MAAVTCAGAVVLRGAIHLPTVGPWYADLVLDTATAPSGKVTLAVDGGLSLAGFAVVAGVFLDAAHVRLVGGAGGWQRLVSAEFRDAHVRDPLGAILQQAGEAQSSTIAASLLTQALASWSIPQSTAATALGLLADAAGVNWRVLGDGSVWLGAETWPAATLPAGDAIVEQWPSDGRFEIGCDVPSLLPGVNLAGVGNVIAVDHVIEPSRVRSHAWV